MSPHPARASSTSDHPAASSAGDGSRSQGQTSVSRRELLATAAIGALGGSAGCSAVWSCDDVAITDAYTEVAYGCDMGPYVSEARLEGSAEGCTGTPTVELVDDGEVVREHEIEGDGDWSVPDAAGVGTGRLDDLDGIRVRDASGDVVAEEVVEVDHYSDEPGLFVDVEPYSLADEPVAVGESVELDVTVGNLGGAGEYVVWLRADGEDVASREGSVDRQEDCTHATGPEYAFAHTFEEPGEYDLTVDVEPLGAGDSHPARELGPVTVTES